MVDSTTIANGIQTAGTVAQAVAVGTGHGNDSGIIAYAVQLLLNVFGFVWLHFHIKANGINGK